MRRRKWRRKTLVLRAPLVAIGAQKEVSSEFRTTELKFALFHPVVFSVQSEEKLT